MRGLIGERSEPLSDKLGGEISIAARACMYLYLLHPPPLTVHFSMTRSVIYQPIIYMYTLYYTLHTEHAYCLSYRFLNNLFITTVIEMVEMVEILDGRLGKRSVERVRYVTRESTLALSCLCLCLYWVWGWMMCQWELPWGLWLGTAICGPHSWHYLVPLWTFSAGMHSAEDVVKDDTIGMLPCVWNNLRSPHHFPYLTLTLITRK